MSNRGTGLNAKAAALRVLIVLTASFVAAQAGAQESGASAKHAKHALFVREAPNLFDTSGQLTDEQTKASLRAVINAFGMWIERVSAPRTAA